MARLHEYQGKQLLLKHKIPVPQGKVASTVEEVREIAGSLNGPVVIKVQSWTTGRAAIGGIQFAENADEAAGKAEKMLGMKVMNFTVDRLMVEERLDIDREFYAGFIIDDNSKKPVVIFSSIGGSGIETLVVEHPDKVAKQNVDVVEGLRDYEARNLVRKTGIGGGLQMKLGTALTRLAAMATACDARSAEINPLVVTKTGDVLAADCRITIDDYAVFRHPELGIEIAREFDRPPTELDIIAYNVEKNDYRGTFYFIQMEQGFKKGQRFVGFHGAGGGGSMMSMDAVNRQGFKIANFTDTSGNPPASKVYRAARIILSQKNIDAYFGSGSGVASQEQFHSARGLVKAFIEENLSVPCVIRLGGNSEDRAVDILTTYTGHLPAPVEGYKKDDSADFCAERLASLVDDFKPRPAKEIRKLLTPEEAKIPYSFETTTGSITYDHALCTECETKVCVRDCVPQILKLEDGKPVLAITTEEAKKGKCTECLACEIECLFHGNGGSIISLPIPGLESLHDA